jgi:hypothetical protein
MYKTPASFMAGCSTTHSGFRKPDLSKVRNGITKAEVIGAMGQPDDIATHGRVEYLEYGWDKFMDGSERRSGITSD